MFPDGNIIIVDAERFRSSQSIVKCDVDIRKDLRANVVL